MGSIYALVALGFGIIHNATGIINFAQGEFLMLGGMLMVTLVGAAGLPLWAAFALAAALVVLIGLLFERVLIRPVRQASVITLIVITIGASITIRSLAEQLWGTDALPVPAFSGEEALRFGGCSVMPQSLWVMGVTAVAVLGLTLFYSRTLIGKAMRACAINRVAAQLMGISVPQMVAWSFALAAGLGAIGGIVVAPITMTQFDVGVMLGLKGFCGAIIGGLGNSAGAVVGGLALGVLEALGGGLISSGYKDIIAFAILLLVLLVRPSGVLGSAAVDSQG